MTRALVEARARTLDTRRMSSATRDIVSRSFARAGIALNPIERVPLDRRGMPYASFADRQTAIIRAWDATGDVEDRKDARTRTWWAIANGHRVPC